MNGRYNKKKLKDDAKVFVAAATIYLVFLKAKVIILLLPFFVFDANLFLKKSKPYQNLL